MKFMIVGQGGRESSFAKKLAEDSVVYAAFGHKNPTIVDIVDETGGRYITVDIKDGHKLADFAQEEAIDYVFVNCDDPLAAGIVDILLDRGIKAIGPTKAGARIEWDKIFSIQLIDRLLPQYTPVFKVISTQSDIDEAIQEFAESKLEIVVKPQGLTGGKGVKVMGKHLHSQEDVKAYIIELLEKKPGEQVLLVEKLEGLEFTIMGITDGEHTVFSPASYDYPYRYEQDKGAGTGGMGCFTDITPHLPFMTEKQYEECTHIMSEVLKDLKAQGLHFNGVLNGGFFVTEQGIKFMEFNGRFGDPEGINILSILDSNFSKILEAIYHQNLSENDVVFKQQASVVKYLVSPSYPEKGDPIRFELPIEQFESEGLSVVFSSAIRNENGDYQTVSSSRVVGISGVGDSVPEASDRINTCIDRYFSGGLEYRRDIGSAEEIERLKQVF
ncbi:phosphoribosylamine--glycine ligase-like [Ylistrum balloti]|uniref:phosphoribosylamine--glycine ligase-like n=1 Tax=Ylistrum balloti TaxID=509963 RepID=UPI002905B183|nr:phosphoribosylamine--glycine ligase-like [Ylistrum balloti]